MATRNLSEENLLAPNIRAVNTWPYVPGGLIGINDPLSDSESDRITNELQNEYRAIEKAIDNIKEKQILITTWLLAVIIGLVGNLFVNLLFDPFGINFSNESLLLLGVIGAILVLFISIVFVYLPININYQFRFMPPWKYPSKFVPKLPATGLTAKAQVITTYQTSFYRHITEFAQLISLGILRDELSRFEGKRLALKKITKMTPTYYPFYIITFDFKKSLFFWYRNMSNEIREELNEINGILTSAKIGIGVFRTDEDVTRWGANGVSFLNEVAKWDFEQLNSKILNQILGVENEKGSFLKKCISSIRQIPKAIIKSIKHNSKQITAILPILTASWIIGLCFFLFIQNNFPKRPLLSIYFLDVFIILFPICGFVILLLDLKRQNEKGSKKTLVIELIAIICAMIIKILVSKITPNEVITDQFGQIVLFFTIFLVSFFTIFRNKLGFNNPQKYTKIYLAIFGASIIWFSSISSDLIDLVIRIYLGTLSSSHVIGGAGLNDGLFIFGTTTFVTMCSFYIIWCLIMKTLDCIGLEELVKKIELN